MASGGGEGAGDTVVEDGPLQWEEYFMGMAAMASKRSKMRVKAGAIVADKDKQIVGVGYNGLPLHVVDEPNRAEEEVSDLMVDAHTNAILFSSLPDLRGCVMYATCFPTKESAKVLIQAKIKELYFLSHGTRNIPNYDEIKSLLQTGKVETKQFKPSRRTIEINFQRFGETERGVHLQQSTD